MTSAPAAESSIGPLGAQSEAAAIAAGTSELGAALDTSNTVRELVGADYARLKAVLSQVKQNVNVTATSVARLQTAILVYHEREQQRLERRHRPDEPQSVEPKPLLSPADDAFAQVRAREAILRESIAAASMASPEAAAAAQAQVAADYEAYARAVTVAESMARAASRAALANAGSTGF